MLDQKNQYLRKIILLASKKSKEYPFNLKAVSQCSELQFDTGVTYLVGENGSGKSTLLEGIALAYGFNGEGGSKNFNFKTKATHSSLHRYLRLVKGSKKVEDGFFLRAETFYNLATDIDDLGINLNNYGEKSLHVQSHGEAFMALFLNRFKGGGLYILDEPESALSPTRQMAFLKIMHELIQQDSQFIIATHSPIIMAYAPGKIYELGSNGYLQKRFEETSHYQIFKRFLEMPEKMLELLINED